MYNLLRDTPELAAGFSLWLATQGEKVDFLRGRYSAANWDVDELLAKREEIKSKNLLWTRVVGQEQVYQETMDLIVDLYICLVDDSKILSLLEP
jgi:hypothetical protein